MATQTKGRGMDVNMLSVMLQYNHEDGTLTWLERPQYMFPDLRSYRVWNAQNANRPAMTAISNGYLTGRLFGKTQYAHRIAWAIFNKRWPDHQIDHIDGNRANNKISNLRHATHTENARNTSSRSGATSRFLGVSWNTRRGMWEARIKAGGKNMMLGLFACEMEAAKAYNDAGAAHFGEFAKLNVVGEAYGRSQAR